MDPQDDVMQPEDQDQEVTPMEGEDAEVPADDEMTEEEGAEVAPEDGEEDEEEAAE